MKYMVRACFERCVVTVVSREVTLVVQGILQGGQDRATHTRAAAERGRAGVRCPARHRPTGPPRQSPSLSHRPPAAEAQGPTLSTPLPHQQHLSRPACPRGSPRPTRVSRPATSTPAPPPLATTTAAGPSTPCTHTTQRTSRSSLAPSRHHPPPLTLNSSLLRSSMNSWLPFLKPKLG